MDPTKIDSLVHRLVANPHDEDALAVAHQAGALDPKSYALLLERVGVETDDAGYASHWLSEAANVWSTTLGDAHRAARVLMQAIDRDPTQRVPSDRLAQLYREKADYKALVALLERRAKSLASIAPQSAEVRAELAEMHEELGRLWNDNLQQPKKAQENLRRAIELGDPVRQIATLRDEAAARRAEGDLSSATAALGRACAIDPADVTLQQEYGALIVERVANGEPVPAEERALGVSFLAGLAEMYDGEHGFAYSAGALDIDPGHDRAIQLYAFYAHGLQREDDVGIRYLAYIAANPGGPMAREIRGLLAGSYEAAGQPENAIQILEPLGALGDPEATAKLRDLYAQTGRPMLDGEDAEPPPASAVPAPSRRTETGGERVDATLDEAQTLAKLGKRPDAYKKYREVLERDPVHPEALSWVQDYLRTKRDYAPLRDVLLAAVRATGEGVDARRDRLREIAGLCESNLRDTEGAIAAWKQLLAIDQSDEAARHALTRMLERAQRWDELATLYEQEENVEVDLEKKLVLEKKLATLHETKRKDLTAAAEAWERIANMTPEDDGAIATAADMFAKNGALDRAALVIATNAPSVTDPLARGSLLERLGALYEELDDPSRAAEAYADAAAEGPAGAKLWEAAERCFVAAERWDRAAQAAVQRAEREAIAPGKARHFARSADYLGRSGDDSGALVNLIQAAEIDPTNEEYAQQVADRYTSALRWDDLVQLLLKRADHADDVARRTALRKQAADLYANQLGDKEAARDTWRKILGDGTDEEAAERLIDDAIARGDHAEAVELLQRLEKVAKTAADKTRIALREAELMADGVGDVESAIGRYERIVAELDPSCRLALQAIADLQEARDNPTEAARALDRELEMVADATERAPIATRLANLYEQLGKPDETIRALEIAHAADPDDFDALTRLCDLCEKREKWAKLAELLAQRIEVEGDEVEAAVFTRKLSAVLAEKLDRGDEALATLTEMADHGDPGVRAAYVELGDRLGWRGIVAAKMVEWWLEAPQSAERTTQLRGAFDRFVEVGRDEEAVRVATELVRSRGADRELAEELEKLSAKTKDLDALSTAHDLIARELTGIERARELVRQAEARVLVGAPPIEAIHHGEAGLTSVPALEAEEFLRRLAALADKPADVVDLYERQVSRCKSPSDRVAALARAAQVAAAHKLVERARGFFDLALSAAPSEEGVATLEHAARAGDEATGGEALRRALAAALENGGQGARDGGRTRGALLRRAALLTHRDLNDLDEAFVLLGVALVAYVDPLTLDALDALAQEIGDPRRAEETLSHVLEEVFDGPLVRQLLARRAKLRREQLGDTAGAAADLKKLHDLSPNDAAVLSELTALLTELNDHRGLVRVLEDQILRGKDMSARAELARKVAQMWEVELADPREAADAWRRVLRMKQGDPEATSGLERAKSNMLKTLEPASERRPSATPAGSPTDEAASETPATSGERSTLPGEGDGHEGAAGETAPHATADVTAAGVDPIDLPDEADLTNLDMGPVEHPADPEPPGETSVVTATPTEPPDFTDPTHPHSATASPPTESELVMDPDGSGEAIVVDEDVLLPDDYSEAQAEAAEVPDAEPAQKPSKKRTIPPPLPRSG